MESKVKRVLNLSADKVEGYVFKDSPSIFWSWWHVLGTLALALVLVSIFTATAQAATLPAGERIECRIEVDNVFTHERRVTFKAYDSSKIKQVAESYGNLLMIQVHGDEQVPEATIKLSNGELFAVRDKEVYRGICRNGKTIKVYP